uniref:Synaptopodin 2-like protein n=1 Tax=Oryzias latipes TaxID=8090 RepID=A0A3P9KWR5_ORYLA
MGEEEEVVITLSGGAPWGFRLQGGVEHQKPLQVAKVRKRSKACRAGLREADELVSINDQPCGLLSHAQAMNLIDSSPGILDIRVKRSEAQKKLFSPSPRIDKEYRAVHRSRSSLTSGLTSPPGSEAYYGETDSDADVAGYERQRRQKRRSPSNSSPGKPAGRASPEGGETSEMSGYDSAPDAHLPPKEALLLGSRNQLVPMVGPVDKPIDEELTTTYMEKAKQAKLNRGDTLQDKHVKEAKSKCRTIASLLTDAPNPHSKGVLMFKKRRQRSKKYTLTSFGSVDEDKCQDSQEEDGVFQGSESEFDEEGFSAVPDPTWDSDYLDKLEKRATAGTEGRGNEVGDGAQLFEQQRKRFQQVLPPGPTSTLTVSMVMSPPPVSSKPVNASVTFLTSPAPPTETPQPEQPVSNVLNRTARPFTPGFISIRAATAPVTFRPTVTKRSQRPASAAVAPPPQVSSAPEQPVIAPPVSFYQPPDPPAMLTTPYSVPQSAMVQSPEISVPAPPQATLGPIPVPPFSQFPGSTKPTVSEPTIQVPVAQAPPQFCEPPVAQMPVASNPEAVASAAPTGRTGILLEARRRGGKPKPMFNIPDAKKNSPNPELLSMVQNLDDRSSRHKHGQSFIEEDYDGEEEERSGEADTERIPPPVAPKPRVIHENPQSLQAGGKGAQLFAKRQSRMGRYVVDTPPEIPSQRNVSFENTQQVYDGTSFPSQWKYSPNVRAPPPIGYNPLMAPSIPTGPQRDANKSDSKGKGGSQKEGIKALDFMRRQPYQLNSAMFNYGERLSHSAKLPSLPKFSSTPFSHPLPPAVPTPYTPVSHTTGLRTAKQFQSAPELSILASLPPLKPNPVQAPKPHFVATKGGVQPRVWKPGAI